MAKSRRKSTKKGSKLTVVQADNSLTGKDGDTGIANTSAETPTTRNPNLRIGNPGNKGGGRTPEAIRGTFRQIIEEHGIPWVMRVLSGEEGVEPGVKTRLLDTLVRAAIGTQQVVEHKGTVLLMGKSLSE